MTKDEFKKEFNSIYNCYNEKLIACHNFSMSGIYNPMLYLGTYLKFMRDYYLLTTPDEDDSEETNVTVSAIMAACKLYDQLEECKKALKKDIPEEDTKKLTETKVLLQQKFWQLIALNMEDWLAYDA